MDDLLKIAAQIPYGRVNLSKTNLHAALEQIMRNTVRSNALLSSLIRCHLFAAGFDCGDFREVGRQPVWGEGFHIHFH
jgi:hypothetical protein